MAHWRSVACVVLAAASGRSLAAQLPGDSSLLRLRPPVVRPLEALAIGGGIGLAALLDPAVRDLFQGERSTLTNDAATIGNSLGHLGTVGPALAAAWLVGAVAGERQVADAVLWAAGAGAATGVITAGLKEMFGRSRPPANATYNFRPFSGNHSFPSGHTSFSFAIASSLAHATPDRWSDGVFYAAASLTGLSRINDDKHWFSDVVGGAILGILVGRQLTGGRAGRRSAVSAASATGIKPMIGPGWLGVGVSAEF
jgi:membrane-associated phospholipid phosphatase